jgi:hypothetical protein
MFVSGSVSSTNRLAAPQFANGIELGASIPQTNTWEWVDIDPSSVGLDRAAGSIAIERNSSPPVVWLKVSAGGGSDTDWVALSSGGSGSSTSVQWPAAFASLGPDPAPAGAAVGSNGAGAVDLANAAAVDSSTQLVGITLGGAPGPITVQSAGPFTQSTAAWDALNGSSGGLTAGDWYYVSATTPGALTNVAPSASGDFVIGVGIAYSATTLIVMPQPAIGPL